MLRLQFLIFTLIYVIKASSDNSSAEKLLELEKKVNILAKRLEHCEGKAVQRKVRDVDPVIAFSAAITSNVSPVAPSEIIVYDHVHINQGNAYDPNVGGFKATVNGIYHFAATIMSYSSNYIEIELVHSTPNGSPTVLCRARASQSYNAMGTCIVNVRLAVGDDVWVRHYSSRGNYIYGSLFPTFSGHLIYAE